MGNVIGLTPARTGIAICRLLNAQLRHMPGSECVRCINNLYFGHRHDVGKLHNTVCFTKFIGVFPLTFLRF